jgi:hypothetical protein
MKIIALGDTHGRTAWKAITEKEDFELLIFVGDYFDTHDAITPQQQIDNFKDILRYKEQHSDKVVLLFGNHDFHYLKTALRPYSGFQRRYKEEISALLHGAIDKGWMQMCFVQEGFLFSHAGVTKTWCAAHHIDLQQLETAINALFLSRPQAFEFTPGENFDMYGDDVTQTPIWVRPNSLFEDRVPSYIQVVGHTQQRHITLSTDVILIDALGAAGEYLAIINGVPEVGRVAAGSSGRM